MSRRLLALIFALLVSGCNLLLGGVEVEHVSSSIQKPSNVAIYLAASDDGKPLTELDESNFVVFENDQEIPKSQANLKILSRDVAAVHHVLLLVDLSGKLDDAETKSLTAAIESFVETVRPYQAVTVYGFDGGERIYPLGEFSEEETSEKAKLSGKIEQRDPSRNLNGAIPKALQELAARLMHVKRPVRQGSLVVFTRGPDVAGRTSADELQQTLEASSYDRFSIGFEGEDTYYLEQLGEQGTVLAKNMAGIGPAFEEAALKVNKALERHYLVQYCSPARAGVRQLRLEVRYVNKAGEQRSGSLSLEFDAKGFGPGCDSSSTPRFVVAASLPGELGEDSTPEKPAKPKSGAKGQKSAAHQRAPAAQQGDEGEEPSDEGEDETFVPPPDKPGYE